MFTSVQKYGGNLFALCGMSWYKPCEGISTSLGGALRGEDKNMPSYNNMTDGDLNTWSKNFASVAGANAAALGLSAPQAEAIQDASDAFSTSLTARFNAFDAAKAATTTKNTDKLSMLEQIRLWANQWQANPNISDELKQELGLSIHDTSPTPRPVFAPTSLSASGNSAGTNSLKWNRNGNYPGTNFIVEVSYDFSGDWSYVATSTKSDYQHLNQEPGRPTMYRVYAERPTGRSENSNIAGVYIEDAPESSSSSSTEEAAA